MPGKRLVAPGERDQRVEALGVHHRLDRVGDDLAAHERRPHALVAHRDAVAHRDGGELDREAAGVTHALPWPAWPAGRAACCTGVTSFHDDATPTWDLSQSSSVMPTARSMARAGARS